MGLEMLQLCVCVVQVDAVTAEEQKVIAFSDKTDIGRVMLNEDTR